VTSAGVAAFVVGAVLVLSGSAKLASRAWPAQARALGAPKAAIVAVPPLELGLGVLLLVGIGRAVVALASAALLVAFTALLAVRLQEGRRPPCACFGPWSSRPIGPGSIARNVVLIALALLAALA
jgi:hypothetical protein